MSATTDFQGTYKFDVRHRPAGTIANMPASYVVIAIDDGAGNLVRLYFHGTTQADDSIKAGIAALDMPTQDSEAPPEPMPRDIVEGDLGAIPPNRIGDDGGAS